MSLEKREYTDLITVIPAKNLNDIQDAIIALEEKQPDVIKNLILNATCTSLATAQVKEINVSEVDSLYEGLNIRVTFQFGQSYGGNAQLKVNDLEAKAIYIKSGVIATAGAWSSGEVVDMVYDGTKWVMVDGGRASTSEYGATKLVTTATSQGENSALTPKSIYQLAYEMIAHYPVYTANTSYAVGDRVRYGYKVWRCITAIEKSPLQLDETKWEALKSLHELVDESFQLGLTGASVGDLVRVKTVDTNGKPTSWRKAPLCDITTNENWLVNGYFVGGGSQRTDISGCFPINQRGKTQYSSGYAIDRWTMTGSTLNLEVQSEFIRINKRAATGNPGFLQILPDNLDGRDVTISILYKTSAPTGTIRLLGLDTTIALPASSDFNIFSVTAKLLKTSFDDFSDKVMFGLQFRANLAIDVYTDIKAMKVELGSEQTLAHQESGAWVLNEIPGYGQELARCQRYLLTIASNSAFRCCVRTGNYFDFWVPTPVSMASSVTVLGAENCQIHEFGGNVIDGFSYSVPIVSDNGVRFRATKSSHGGTDADLRTTGKVWLSAE